jgi:hypothetical protein
LLLHLRLRHIRLIGAHLFLNGNLLLLHQQWHRDLSTHGGHHGGQQSRYHPVMPTATNADRLECFRWRSKETNHTSNQANVFVHGVMRFHRDFLHVWQQGFLDGKVGKHDLPSRKGFLA